jgi:4-amino-4-deoxy-L-arabinose transferase-like glycosyltransferase
MQDAKEPRHDLAGRAAPPNRRRFLVWLPYLWSQVLFPGTDAEKEPVRLGSLSLLLFLPAILLYVRLSYPLFEPDEGRYAEIPREMLVRGDWVVPYLQGEPYLDKPPLLYWLVAASYCLFGVQIWSARLIPALALHACILITYFLGRRSLGERAAFWGALWLGLAPGFASVGRLLVLDGLLTLWATLSVFSAFEAIRGEKLHFGWWLLSAAACGLGILTKGPVAVLLLLPPLWMYRWLKGKSSPIGRQAVCLFGLVVLVVALPWYIAINVRLPGTAAYFLWHHNVVRFLAPFDHLRPVWFYVPILLAGLLPGSFFLIPFVRFLFSGKRQAFTRRSPALGFTLLAGGWCVFFFSLSGCKLPTYIMPAFPPLALALGYYLVASRWPLTDWPKAVTGVAFVVVCFVHNWAIPWYADYRGPLGRLAELQKYCEDRQAPILCYPRNCDSVAFYVGRDDMRSYRSKEINPLIRCMQQHPRTILLLTHRHSLQALRYALPRELRVVEQQHFGLSPLSQLPDALAEKLTWWMGETSLGLCDLVVIERRRP